jgi:hypothetical protein
MMLSPGLMAENCPNRETCGILTELTPEEEVELVFIRQIQQEQREAEAESVREVVRVNQRQAAVMMLRARGCSQTPQSLGVIEMLAQVESRLDQLREQLSQYDEIYIAPTDCELHHYKVKRPSGVYEYNKLTAGNPIFEPSEKKTKVKVIHLSHDDDSRNLEGRAGIERRNKLLSLMSRLHQIEGLLVGVLAEL